MQPKFVPLVACAGIAAVLVLAGCDGKPLDPSTPAGSESVQSDPSPSVVSPSASAGPSLPAGIPTAPPSAPKPSSSLVGSARITLATVDPVTGGLFVGGFVSGVVEDGGDCQFVITPTAGESMTIHQLGAENSATTSCGSVLVPAADVPSGDYSVTLVYANANGSLSSEAVAVVVP